MSSRIWGSWPVRSLKRLWRGAVIVIALVVLAVTILITGTSDSAEVAAVSSLFAAFGLTWKGLGATVGKAAAKGEQAVWDAQVDWTIAFQVTVWLDAAARDKRSPLQQWRDWRTRWPAAGVTNADD